MTDEKKVQKLKPIINNLMSTLAMISTIQSAASLIRKVLDDLDIEEEILQDCLMIIDQQIRSLDNFNREILRDGNAIIDA